MELLTSFAASFCHSGDIEVELTAEVQVEEGSTLALLSSLAPLAGNRKIGNLLFPPKLVNSQTGNV